MSKNESSPKTSSLQFWPPHLRFYSLSFADDAVT